MPTAATRRLSARAALAAAVLAVLTACGHGDLPVTKVASGVTSAPAPSRQGAAAPVTQGSGPCLKPLVNPGLSNQSIMSGGQRRTVLAYYPRGHRPGKPIPLLLDLHGSGGTPTQQLDSTGITGTAEKRDFAVVAPQGGIRYTLGRTKGFAWNIPGVPLLDGHPAPKDAPDDVQFLRDTVATMSKLVCADSRRVYVTGFSGGARMTSLLGCEMSDRIAAIAPVSGLRFPADCRPGRPVPVISFHGTADAVNQYNGGKSPYWNYSVPAAAQRWAREDHCAAAPRQHQVRSLVNASTYAGCRGGAQVELLTITNGRHAWPGTPGSTAHGAPTPRIDANDLIWSFFSEHPLGSAT
jgi:polyhydroxybutyrate depolymerase